jgi:hypothetical protein
MHGLFIMQKKKKKTASIAVFPTWPAASKTATPSFSKMYLPEILTMLPISSDIFLTPSNRFWLKQCSNFLDIQDTSSEDITDYCKGV